MGADFVSEGVDNDLVGTTGSVDGTRSVVMDHVDESVPMSDSTVIKTNEYFSVVFRNGAERTCVNVCIHVYHKQTR